MTPSLAEREIFTALGNLLQAVLPANVTVEQGQINRTSSPLGDYVVMWPLRRPRFSTNVETPIDTKFTAALTVIDANTAQMAVSHVFTGDIENGNQIFGVGVADSTVVQSQNGGAPGGIGTYIVTPSQAVSSETMSAGVLEIAQSTEFVAQIDVHGPNSGDNAQVISTILRSSFAVDQMDGTGVTPLYSEDPRQMPFTTAAAQFEERWIVEAHLQIVPTISTPQQFADAVTVTTVDVDVAYPD